MSEEKTLMDFVKPAQSQIHEIEVLNVKDLLDEGYQVLDVREPAKFMSGTIEGASNIPRGILEAAAVIQQMGFKNIRNINGGITAWKAAELAVTIPPQH